MNNFTSGKQIDLHFVKKKLPKEFPIVKDGKPLRLRRGMIKESIDKMPIIICKLLIEQMLEESCYNMTDMQVQRYPDERILETTLTSEVSSNNDTEITAIDMIVDISPNETKTVAKVVAEDLEILAQTYLC